MPLTTEQTEAVKAALNIEGADAKELAEAVKAAAGAVYQNIFQAGHSTATTAAKAKEKTITDELTAKTAEVEQLTADLEAEKKKTPDTEGRVASLEAALAKAKDDLKNAKKEGSERVRALHAAREKEAVVAKLIESGVDPDYAREVLAAKLAPRIRVTEDTDGNPVVAYLDADGLSPLGTGQAGLIEQGLAGLDAKWITSKAKGGTGTGNGTTGAGGYDPVADGKARAAAQKASTNGDLAFK